jgi:hypothetical protein
VAPALSSERRREAGVAAAVALVCFLPFARGLLAGATLYFRDLALQFFPVRRFVAEGLRQGQLRYWNPYSFEGVPLSPLPLAYPLDLLHALEPREAFFSLLLALHIPFAAVALYALARRLGTGRLAAAGGGALFALGGFSLSCVNLYVYAQALPWVVLGVLALRRAAAGGRREFALAALAAGILLTTTAVEFALQAFVVGLVLAPREGGRRGLIRLLASIGLGFGLAAYVLAPAAALLPGSARGAGFPTEVVLAHSVHPVALLQALVAGLFGDPDRLADVFWGERFFPRGFPYFLSLYVGALGLALAVAGISKARPLSRRLALLAGVCLVLCLGTFAGLGPLVDLLGALRRVRFPAKAYLSVHLAVALLAAFGLDALARAERGARRRFGTSVVALGLLIGAGPAVALRVPAAARYLLGGFFPPSLAWPLRVEYARRIALDAATGAGLALLAGALVWLGARDRLRPAVAALGVTLLLVADLLRAGAGLNPSASPRLLAPEEEVQGLAERLRAEGGRVFTFDPSYSPAYYRARAARAGRHELWSFGLLQDTLTPDTNLASAVPTALSPDRTMLVPVDRVLPPEQAEPASFPSLVGRLRAAGVTHVLSLDPLAHEALSLEQILEPPRMAPLALHVYRLAGSAPLAEIQGQPGGAGPLRWRGDTAEVEAVAERPAWLIVREARAPGWEVSVDGRRATAPAVGRYLAVALPEGRHRVELRYRPPGLLAGAAISGASLLIVLLGLRRRSAAGPGA